MKRSEQSSSAVKLATPQRWWDVGGQVGAPSKCPRLLPGVADPIPPTHVLAQDEDQHPDSSCFLALGPAVLERGFRGAGNAGPHRASPTQVGQPPISVNLARNEPVLRPTVKTWPVPGAQEGLSFRRCPLTGICLMFFEGLDWSHGFGGEGPQGWSVLLIPPVQGMLSQPDWAPWPWPWSPVSVFLKLLHCNFPTFHLVPFGRTLGQEHLSIQIYLYISFKIYINSL